jgi:hypothetical protein
MQVLKYTQAMAQHDQGLNVPLQNRNPFLELLNHLRLISQLIFVVID